MWNSIYYIPVSVFCLIIYYHLSILWYDLYICIWSSMQNAVYSSYFHNIEIFHKSKLEKANFFQWDVWYDRNGNLSYFNTCFWNFDKYVWVVYLACLWIFQNILQGCANRQSWAVYQNISLGESLIWCIRPFIICKVVNRQCSMPQ